MNERIRELAEQAGVPKEYSFVEGATVWKTDPSIERFAELIVRECADIATMNQYQSYTPGHYVLKHFGVEE
jgi:hypothetical protein